MVRFCDPEDFEIYFFDGKGGRRKGGRRKGGRRKSPKAKSKIKLSKTKGGKAKKEPFKPESDPRIRASLDDKYIGGKHTSSLRKLITERRKIEEEKLQWFYEGEEYRYYLKICEHRNIINGIPSQRELIAQNNFLEQQVEEEKIRRKRDEKLLRKAEETAKKLNDEAEKLKCEADILYAESDWNNNKGKSYELERESDPTKIVELEAKIEMFFDKCYRCKHAANQKFEEAETKREEAKNTIESVTRSIEQYIYTESDDSSVDESDYESYDESDYENYW